MNEKTFAELGITRDDLEQVRTAEVGNIFNFGTVKCEQLGLAFTNEAGESIPVHLGSYGIGITRLMGVAVERFADEKGIVWPEAIAPYQVHLVSLCTEEHHIKEADALYQQLNDAHIEVLYDDRQGVRAGEKFADADLLGLPLRIVISPRTLEQASVEIKKRQDVEASLRPLSGIVESICS